MGYYTRYTLEWEKTDAWKAPPACGHALGPKAKFCQECGKPAAGLELDAVVGAYLEEHKEEMYGVNKRGESIDTVKWYDHANDLRAMSVAIPDVLFTLSGEGEESGDIWKGYALNGKWQKHKAKIVAPPMDPKGWG